MKSKSDPSPIPDTSKASGVSGVQVLPSKLQSPGVQVSNGCRISVPSTRLHTPKYSREWADWCKYPQVRTWGGGTLPLSLEDVLPAFFATCLKEHWEKDPLYLIMAIYCFDVIVSESPESTNEICKSSLLTTISVFVRDRVWSLCDPS